MDVRSDPIRVAQWNVGRDFDYYYVSKRCSGESPTFDDWKNVSKDGLIYGRAECMREVLLRKKIEELKWDHDILTLQEVGSRFREEAVNKDFVRRVLGPGYSYCYDGQNTLVAWRSPYFYYHS